MPKGTRNIEQNYFPQIVCHEQQNSVDMRAMSIQLIIKCLKRFDKAAIKLKMVKSRHVGLGQLFVFQR